MTGNVANVASSFSGFLPANTDMNDMAAAVAAGFYGEGEVTYGVGGFNMNFSDATGPGSMAATGDGGLFHFSLSGDGLEYGADGGAAIVQVVGGRPALPDRIRQSIHDLPDVDADRRRASRCRTLR